MSNGADYEDAHDEDVGHRAQNHFHNPTKPYEEAGLYDLGRIVGVTGDSTVIWASDHPNNRWDHESFLHYIEKSFTAKEAVERAESLAKSFRTVGHMVHLLQDMAVPAHVRNELFMGHTKGLKWEMPYVTSPIEHYLYENGEYIRPVDPDKVPRFDSFTDYYDTRQYYAGGRPVSGLSVGLAEYTNSNFFSELQHVEGDGQVWPSTFPYPSMEELYLWDERADSDTRYPHLRDLFPAIFNVKYLGRDTADPERDVRHLARVSFLWKYKGAGEWDGYAYLDEECHKEYLSKLVPKAVAYSAGLMEYLFRGDIDFSVNTFDKTISVTNNGDSQLDGDFSLFYDTVMEGRVELPGLPDPVVPPGETVIIDLPVLDTIRNLGVEQSFTLLFKGSIGAAENMIAGKTKTLAGWEFVSGIGVEYAEIQEPYPRQTFNSVDAETGRRMLTYRCGIRTENRLSAHAISRTTKFYLGVMATPEMSNSLGYEYSEGDSFGFQTSTYSEPGIVEHFKVSPSPGEWVYVYSRSNLHQDQGWEGVAHPAKYYEGLWRPETGYIDLWRGVGTADNFTDQCTLKTWTGGRPDVVVELFYNPDPLTMDHVPECPNAEEILIEAGELCDLYDKLYHDTLVWNLPYLDTIFNSPWQEYGFEIRLSKLMVFSPKEGDGVIFNGPVTITKNYGSSELIVQ